MLCFVKKKKKKIKNKLKQWIHLATFVALQVLVWNPYQKVDPSLH